MSFSFIYFFCYYNFFDVTLSKFKDFTIPFISELSQTTKSYKRWIIKVRFHQEAVYYICIMADLIWKLWFHIRKCKCMCFYLKKGNVAEAGTNWLNEELSRTATREVIILKRNDKL